MFIVKVHYCWKQHYLLTLSFLFWNLLSSPLYFSFLHCFISSPFFWTISVAFELDLIWKNMRCEDQEEIHSVLLLILFSILCWNCSSVRVLVFYVGIFLSCREIRYSCNYIIVLILTNVYKDSKWKGKIMEECIDLRILITRLDLFTSHSKIYFVPPFTKILKRIKLKIDIWQELKKLESIRIRWRGNINWLFTIKSLQERLLLGKERS